MRASVAIASLIAISSFTALASAQNTTTKKDEKLEEYVFPDDKLLKGLGGTSEMIIKGPPITVRTLLTRPRTHFVPELLKTIESL
jgi:hypothetical protein